MNNWIENIEKKFCLHGLIMLLYHHVLNGMHACQVASVVSDSLQSHGLYVAGQAPLSMGFSRQEYWNGLPRPLPGDLPNPGIEPESLMPPVLAGGFFTTGATWEALCWMDCVPNYGRLLAKKKRLYFPPCICTSWQYNLVSPPIKTQRIGTSLLVRD